MSMTLHQPARCTSCGAMIPAGARADRSGKGRSATYRHWNGLCPKGAAAAAPAAPAADHATERQVRYAMDLQASHWTPAVLGGVRYSESDLRAMTREAVSDVISALVAERAL